MYFNVIDFVVFYTKSHDIALSSVDYIDNAVGYVFEIYSMKTKITFVLSVHVSTIFYLYFRL